MANGIKFSPQLEKASGKLEFNMTNDIMFKTVLQKDMRVLKGLISSMLHIPMEEIRDVRLGNIEKIKDTPYDKKFLLDINVILNGGLILNLEMQVVNYKDWKDRSLSYLCRNFDELYKGDIYKNVRSVIHIGFLDYDLFPEHPEFYASYKMINERFNYVFNDKFNLRVLSLRRINEATDEDKLWEIDQWARLFKATTYEEIKMLAEKKEEFAYAAEQILIANSDFWEIERMRRRQDDLRREQEMKAELKQVKEDYVQIKAENTQVKAENNSLKDENKALKEEIARLKAGK